MSKPRAPKDPERQRLGRLGASVVHAHGRTNTGPARAAWEAALAAEVGITDELSPAERAKRMEHALRARMTRLAMKRWANRDAAQGLASHDETGGPDDRRSPTQADQ